MVSFLESYTRPFHLLDRLSNLPFLQGRAFVFAGQFAKFLPLQLAGRYFDASMQVLASSDAGILVKLSAVKAIRE